MNILPSTPTDNIYKFMAISGLWFIAGFIFLYTWFIKTEIDLANQSQKIRSYSDSKVILNKINLRLESINTNEISANKLDWIPIDMDIKTEKIILLGAKDNHQKYIDKATKDIDKEIGNELKLFDRLDVRIVSIAYIILMVFLTVFGFFGWFKKSHKIDEQTREIDLLIKQKTLEKINLEIDSYMKIEYPTKQSDLSLKLKSIEKIDLEINQMKLDKIEKTGIRKSFQMIFGKYFKTR